MFDVGHRAATDRGLAPVATEELRQLVARLGGPGVEVAGDSERVDQLELLERLKSASAACQARISVAFDDSQREAQAAQGVPIRERGRGVADQVALARRDSKCRGSRHLGLAKALVREMPHTLAALASGDISEWRATLVVRETATLSAEHRGLVDSALAGQLAGLGDRATERAARTLAYRLDAGAPLRRIRGAVSDRRVTIRPAPDAMALVTGLLPAAQGVAVFAALEAQARTALAAGDERSRGQIMADTLTERVTGQQNAAAVPLEVQLVMTDAALLDGADTPAQVRGYGPIPAALARRLVRGAESGDGPAAEASLWLRRLYAAPGDGTLVAMDSRRRLFSGRLREFLLVRDQVCRTPWCDAPVRQADHVRQASRQGATSGGNGQGLCQRCNLVKEMPGWSAAPVSGPVSARSGAASTWSGAASTWSGAPPPDTDRGGRPLDDLGRLLREHRQHVVEIRTPTGHRYRSGAPPVLGPGLAQLEGTGCSVLEERLRAVLDLAA